MNLESMANSMNSAYQTAGSGRYGKISPEKLDTGIRRPFAKDVLQARAKRLIEEGSAGVGALKKISSMELEKPLLPPKGPIQKDKGPVYETLPVYYRQGVDEGVDTCASFEADSTEDISAPAKIAEKAAKPQKADGRTSDVAGRTADVEAKDGGKSSIVDQVADPSRNSLRTPEEEAKQETPGREEFAADMRKTSKERYASGGAGSVKTPLTAAQRRVLHEVAPGEFLDTSMMVSRKFSFWNSDRPRLSDDEIGRLAAKYDLRHMTQASYDQFLEEMVEKGVLTQDEIKWFGYGGTVETVEADKQVMVMTAISKLVKETPTSREEVSHAYWSDGSGKAYSGSKYGQHTPFLEDGAEGGGDLFAWMEEMLLSGECWPEGASQEVKDRAIQRCEMYSALNDILTRAASVWKKDEQPSIVNEILNPNSKFYEGMYNRMKLQMERSKEEQEKQAIIDALDAILESLSAKKDDYPRKKSTVRSMAELSQVIDSLDKDDPRKAQLTLLKDRIQQLGIYADLDVGVKDEDEHWETLTESLIREETEKPNLSDII